MSTRYVWEKFTTKQVSTGWTGALETDGTSSWYLRNASGGTSIDYNTSFTLTACTEQPTLGADGLYTPKGQTASTSVSYSSYVFSKIEWGTLSNIIQYRYLVIRGNEYVNHRYFWTLQTPQSNMVPFWKVEGNGSSTTYTAQLTSHLSADYPTRNKFNITKATEQFETQKDQSQGLLSTNKSSSYPTNGTSGSYWYVYKGSDNIDATNVTYSTSQPRGGENITVTITPAKNSLGGTVSYQWYYNTTSSTTSGWTKWGDVTTATSKTYTIPRGTPFFNVRVQAMDNLGFTSTDYTSGGILNVINIRAYIGIDGKARKIKKIYIGVNGKAREVKGGYVGVNGKARRWF